MFAPPVALWQNFRRMIHQRLCWLGLVVVLTLGLLTGCDKPATLSVPSSTLNPPSSNATAPVLRFHWLGKHRLATEATTTNFMAIWNLPESAKLEAQTLAKLATAPWRLWQTNVSVSNAPTALLRPLLDDVVQAESYLEVSGATNQPAELVFAIRLSAARAALWETNLPLLLNSLFAANLTPAGPSSNFTLHTSHFTLQVTRSGAWTLLSARLSPNSSPPSTLLETFRSRIAATQTPFLPSATNHLLEVYADLSRLRQFFAWDWRLPAAPPRVNLVLTAEGNNLRTTGAVLFNQPVPVQLAAWNLPTNTIHDPLIAFTSLRGFDSWGHLLPVPTASPALKIPDQMFSWAIAGYPLQTYFAAPQSAPTNFIRSVSDAITRALSPGVSNFHGRFVTGTNYEKIELLSIPFMEPRLQSFQDSSGEFVVGGLIPMMRTNRPIPFELVAQLLARPELIYYDWEITGPRVEAWVYIGQTMRLILGRAQLPTDSAGLKWLQALLPRVGNSATALTVTSPTQFSFVRTSSMGLTGLELHLLADWLESPHFPAGFHSEQLQPVRRSPPVPAQK